MMPGVLLEYNQSSNLGAMNFKLTFLNISKGSKGTRKHCDRVRGLIDRLRQRRGQVPGAETAGGREAEGG